ncbi:MAG: phage major capsid protein [Actinobacteria bacterium]|nr:phage major capsid protein [Actinomycetota bacterium]
MRRDDILSLKEKRAHLHKEMIDLFSVAEGEEREFSAEEAEKYEKMEGEFRSLTDRWTKAEDLYVQELDVKKALEQTIDLKISDDDDVPKTLTEYRARTRGPLPQDSPEYRAAYWHYLTVKNISELDIEEQRVLSKASAGAGANLVPTDFYNQIINVLRFMGPINELANTITTDSGETIQVPSVTSHGVATWTAENAAYTASDEVFGQVSLNAFKAGRTVIVSEELLTDAAFGLDGYLAQELGESIGVLEETAYAVGDGTGKPMGIANASSGVAVSQAPVGNATGFTYTALVNFVYALPNQYRRNAVWVMADGAAKNFYTMLDGQSRPLWNINVATTGPDTFLGYPIYSSPDLAAPAASAKSGIFGDIRRGYMVRRVNGFSLQRQNELWSQNGQVGFRGFERADGRVVLADAMRVLQHSAT